MSNSEANSGPGVWRWSVEHSPIVWVWRGIDRRLHPMRLTDERLAASDLPQPVKAKIREIVRGTRLWATEREQVCRELMSHGAEALESSTDPAADGASAAESLGDPKAAAPLIRRSMKRKRSAVVQARVWLVRTTGWGFAALVLLYVGLFIRFQTGKPNIKTDYLATINAPLLATPAEDRAISVYRSVAAAWDPVHDKIKAEWTQSTKSRNQQDLPADPFAQMPAIDPNRPQADQVRAAIIGMRPQLDRLHEASRRPVLGYLYSTTPTQSDGEPIPLGDPAPTAMDGALIGVLLPHLGEMRRVCRLLAADARIAADEGDGERVTEDIAALANTARLLSEDPTLIGNLVSLAIQNVACAETNRVLATRPDLLSPEQLLTLSHTIAATGESANTTDLRGESYMFEDLLQRTFTDNGHGDGRLTPNGLHTMVSFADDTLVQPGTISSAMSNVTGPISMEVIRSRAELSAMHRDHMDAAREALAQGPQGLPALLEKERQVERMSTIEQARAYPIALLLPAIARAVENFMIGRMQTDATVTALAIEYHHRTTGTYPKTLEELTPQTLPSVPSDPFDPGRAMKYSLTDAGPMLYVVAADGVDNHGTPPNPEDFRGSPSMLQLSRRLSRRFPMPGASYDRYPEANPTPTGDWVLFPPQED